MDLDFTLDGENRYRVDIRGWKEPIYFNTFDDVMDFYEDMTERGNDVMIYDCVDDIIFYKGEWS